MKNSKSLILGLLTTLSLLSTTAMSAETVRIIVPDDGEQLFAVKIVRSGMGDVARTTFSECALTSRTKKEVEVSSCESIGRQEGYNNLEVEEVLSNMEIEEEIDTWKDRAIVAFGFFGGSFLGKHASKLFGGKFSGNDVAKNLNKMDDTTDAGAALLTAALVEGGQTLFTRWMFQLGGAAIGATAGVVTAIAIDDERSEDAVEILSTKAELEEVNTDIEGLVGAMSYALSSLEG